MPDEPITVFVKLDYWDIYQANVALMFRMFGISLAVLMLVLVVRVTIFVTASSLESPLTDVVFLLGCLLLVAFGSGPLLTARRAVDDDRVRKGILIDSQVRAFISRAPLRGAIFNGRRSATRS